MPGYGYVRVSTNYQAYDGISLDMQKTKIEAYAEYKSIPIEKIVVDEGISGRSAKKRKNLTDLIELLEEGDYFIVYSISRFSRSVKDTINMCSMIEERKASFVSVTESFDTSTAIGKLSFQMLASFSEYESNIDSERVKNAMNQKKLKGEHQGRPRYGWNLKSVKGSGLVPNEEEQKIIRLILELKSREKLNGDNWSYQNVADELNIRGIKPRSNGLWMKSSVFKIYKDAGIEIPTKGRPARESDNRRVYTRKDGTRVEYDDKDTKNFNKELNERISKIMPLESFEVDIIKSNTRMLEPPQVKYVTNEENKKEAILVNNPKETTRKKVLESIIIEAKQKIKRENDQLSTTVDVIANGVKLFLNPSRKKKKERKQERERKISNSFSGGGYDNTNFVSMALPLILNTINDTGDNLNSQNSGNRNMTSRRLNGQGPIIQEMK